MTAVCAAVDARRRTGGRRAAARRRSRRSRSGRSSTRGFDLWPALLAVCGAGSAAARAAAAGRRARRARRSPRSSGRRCSRRSGSRTSGGAAAGRGRVRGCGGVRRRRGRAASSRSPPLAPGGIRHSLTGQLDRPLQVESLGAAILMAAHHLGGLSLTTATSARLAGPRRRTARRGRRGLDGARARRARGRVDRVRPSGAARDPTHCWRGSRLRRGVFVAFGKVFSPQFLIWLVAARAARARRARRPRPRGCSSPRSC